VGVASIGETAYIVGGYDDTSSLDTIVAWSPGRPASVVGHLPVGLRYAAVAATGNRLIILGGAHNAVATRSILAFDAATGRLSVIGRLPAPVAHGTAVTIGSTVYLLGGRRTATTGSQTAQIVAVNPASGRSRVVGRLPRPTSDIGVAATGNAATLAGGLSPTGALATILRLQA
jgi:N-acetylneuraminic acid mutarotase